MTLSNVRPLVLEPVAWWQRWAEDQASPWSPVERLSYHLDVLMRNIGNALGPSVEQASAVLLKFAAAWRGTMADAGHWPLP